jgi:cyclase
MLKTRVIPILLLRDGALVKTVRFRRFNYIGDPCNTVRIFNELEVEELIFLDILAARDGKAPDFQMLSDIANECFMPLSYGGGIRCIEEIKKILNIGLEKVAINSNAVENRKLISMSAERFGSQCIIGSIDVRENLLGKYEVYIKDGTKRTRLDPVEWAMELADSGAGELLITSIDRDGTWKGYDVKLIRLISSSVNIPVIANGGAGNISHIAEAVNEGGASAVGLGSMVVYQKKDMGVLVNFPDRTELSNALENQFLNNKT